MKSRHRARMFQDTVSLLHSARTAIAARHSHAVIVLMAGALLLASAPPAFAQDAGVFRLPLRKPDMAWLVEAARKAEAEADQSAAAEPARLTAESDAVPATVVSDPASTTPPAPSETDRLEAQLNRLLGTITVPEEKPQLSLRARLLYLSKPAAPKDFKGAASQAKSRSTGSRAIRVSQPAISASACEQQLRSLNVEFSRLSDFRNAKGCGIRDGVEISRIGATQFKPTAKLNCATALQTAKWMQTVQQAAFRHYGKPVDRLTHYSAYSCRFRKRGKLSEHASGNALDVAEIYIGDFKTTVLKHWLNNGTAIGAKASAFWKEITATSCRHFDLVLSPVSNAAHANHLHLDLGGWKKCEM